MGDPRNIRNDIGEPVIFSKEEKAEDRRSHGRPISSLARRSAAGGPVARLEKTMGRLRTRTAWPDHGLRFPQPGNMAGNHGRNHILGVKNRLDGGQRKLRVVGVLTGWKALEFSKAG